MRMRGERKGSFKLSLFFGLIRMGAGELRAEILGADEVFLIDSELRW